jgi:hypothetical protein
VITSSSKPKPLSGRALAKRAVKTTPATAASVPETTKSRMRMRSTSTPEKRAASALLPMAKM